MKLTNKYFILSVWHCFTFNAGIPASGKKDDSCWNFHLVSTHSNIYLQTVKREFTSLVTACKHTIESANFALSNVFWNGLHLMPVINILSLKPGNYFVRISPMNLCSVSKMADRSMPSIHCKVLLMYTTYLSKMPAKFLKFWWNILLQNKNLRVKYATM